MTKLSHRPHCPSGLEVWECATAMPELVSAILSTTHQSLLVPSLDAALEKWSVGHNETPPTSAGAVREKMG